MAITLVDHQIGSAGDGNNVTITFPASTVLENDVTILIGGHSDNATPGSAAPVTTGYTHFLAKFESATKSIGAWYKVQGATPDSNVVGAGDGVAQHAVGYIAYTLRGVDTTAVPDATAVISTEVNDGAPYDGPSITTVTDGAWVISAGFDGNVNVTAAPTGYSNLLWANIVDTVRLSLAAATKEVASAGAEDPGAYSDTSTTSDRIEITLAIRPSGGAPPAAAVKRFLAMMGVGR